MASQLENALKAFPPETTVEIVLDGKAIGLKFTPESAKLFAPFTNLKSLSLVGNSISSLENFPDIPTLTSLNLDDNDVSDGLDHLANAVASLRHLSLVGNSIATVDALQPLFLVYEFLLCPHFFPSLAGQAFSS